MTSLSAGAGAAAGGKKTVVIALDGGAASGKGTLSKAIAAAFNLAHLVSRMGCMAVCRFCMMANTYAEHVCIKTSPA